MVPTELDFFLLLSARFGSEMGALDYLLTFPNTYTHHH